MYPAGRIGAGLLILRLSVIVSLLTLALSNAATAEWRQGLAFVVAAALCIGFRSRVFALLSILGVLDALARGEASFIPAVIHTFVATPLVLTGAGAFSIDAQLFGRRRLRLPDANDTSV